MDLHLLGALHGNVTSELTRLTAAALVAGLWQGILLCAGTGLILKLAPKTTATLRFVVWIAVFGVSVTMPLVNLSEAKFAGQVGSAATSHVLLDLRWSYLLVALWVVAAAYRLAQLAMQAFGLLSLWKGALPVAAEALTVLDVPLAAGGRRVELCTSDEVDRPSVIGFLAPRILIPTWLFEQLTPLELNHIVLHEMEHLRRGDDWVNLLQKIGLALLPLNPALFWIDRRLSKERELACDDGVLERTNMPRAYAASLASIAERRLDVRRHGRFGALALAATGLRRRRSELGERIESILGRRTPVNRAVAGGLAGIFIVGVIGAGAGLSRAPQLVSFGPQASGEIASVHALAASRDVDLPLARSSRITPTAKFQDVSFRGPLKPRVNNVKAVTRNMVPEVKVWRNPRTVLQPLRQRQFVVLTSWENSPVSRVVVQTPDGSFFLAPYAAVPTQAGWLLVQL